MQHKGLVLSAIGVLLLVFAIGLVGGCSGSNALQPGYEAIHGTWWQNPFEQGVEYVKLVVGNGTWTVTQKECGPPVEIFTFTGTWTYNETTAVYTIKEDGEPDDMHATVANDILTIEAEGVMTLRRTEHIVPCP